MRFACVSRFVELWTHVVVGCKIGVGPLSIFHCAPDRAEVVLAPLKVVVGCKFGVGALSILCCAPDRAEVMLSPLEVVLGLEFGVGPLSILRCAPDRAEVALAPLEAAAVLVLLALAPLGVDALQHPW